MLLNSASLAGRAAGLPRCGGIRSREGNPGPEHQLELVTSTIIGRQTAVHGYPSVSNSEGNKKKGSLPEYEGG